MERREGGEVLDRLRPTIFGFRRGETEYVIAAIPLGGFVKMLGEGPDDETSKSTDPRAYPNKSVGARMAIISAGVIMNVFLGLACFVYAYGHGMEVTPAKVGAVLAGSPAYKAGLLAGDEIVAIDGRRDVSYKTLMLKVSLSRQDQILRFGVQRPGHDGLITMDIQPVREANNDRPTIGVLPSESLESRRFPAPAGDGGTTHVPGARPPEVGSLRGHPGRGRSRRRRTHAADDHRRISPAC